MTIKRYSRQILVKELGNKGQRILSSTHAVVLGGGGLGSNSANLLVRMGIGSLDIIDQDIVDITNLHRTALFTEHDIGKPKATVLQQKLHAINTDATIKGIQKKITKENIESLISHADILLDGTDSIPLRFLINKAAIHRNIPWVYAGVAQTTGMVLGIQPRKTPCFHCLNTTLPKHTSHILPVFGTLPAVIAAIQTNEAIKLILGKPPAGLILYNTWDHCFDIIDVKKNPYCLCCSTTQKKITARKKK